MALKSILTFVCILLLASINTGVKAIHIEITPETFDEIVHEEININCTADNSENLAKEIVLIEIVKQNPIVVYRVGGKPSFPGGDQARFVATGQITANVKQSYLSLTIENYKTNDSGEYTCVLYYIDNTGLIKISRSRRTLNVQKADIGAFGTALKFLKKRIVTLETDFKEKVTHISAFVATTRRNRGYLARGTRIVFPLLLLNQGNEYNVTTGVFSAKKAGLYAFQLVLRKTETNRQLIAEIKTKTKTVGRLSLMDRSYQTQSSISVLVELQVNDDIWVENVGSQGVNIFNSMETMFSGYLIRPF